MHRTALLFLCLLSGFVVSTAPSALGQEGPPAMGSHDQGGPGGRHGMGGPVVGRLLPPGIWWKQTDLVQALSLSADQQKKMDEIFQQSRIQLVHITASLEEERIRMEPMLDATPFDSGRVMGEVDKIAGLRAELEKADARMLLGLRSVLTADQWTKLQALKRSRQTGGAPEFRGRSFGGSSHGYQKNNGPCGGGEPPPM